ncbi:unnamed protein product [Rotaria sp. Silwood1]|nr:unnamed protein product [Rotaria sp. Silwood1]CAF5085562.1 unnamed protein product [Rotaria sp. Silwood1]
MLDLKDTKKALNYFEQSSKIKRNVSTTSSESENTDAVHGNICILCVFFSHYQMALKYYQKALSLALKTLSNNDRSICQYRNNIADIKKKTFEIQQ